MAITNHERAGKALELLAAGLTPFVERELKSTYQQGWLEETRRNLAATQMQFLGTAHSPQWDAQALLLTIWNQWNDVFRKTLGPAGKERGQRECNVLLAADRDRRRFLETLTEACQKNGVASACVLPDEQPLSTGGRDPPAHPGGREEVSGASPAGLAVLPL